MHRREVLAASPALLVGWAGCSGPEVEHRPTGEIDVSFRTEASRDVVVGLELRDARGDVVDEFESPFPPGEEGAPSFYAGGLVDGPYTVVIRTQSAEERFEWSIDECRSLAVSVLVRSDASLTVERDCSAADAS